MASVAEQLESQYQVQMTSKNRFYTKNSRIDIF